METGYFLKDFQTSNPSSFPQPPSPPVDENFSLIIPKIDINTKVFPDVDPYNRKEYENILKQGVAHAKGTAYPGQDGNTFIFAHSASGSDNIKQYNAVFYLLNKLEEGDEIYLIYQAETFVYKVIESKIINPTDVEYLESNVLSNLKVSNKGQALSSFENGKFLTLMTCWPLGTTLKRMLVIAQIV